MDITMIDWGGVREWLYPICELLVVLAATIATTYLWGQ